MVVMVDYGYVNRQKGYRVNPDVIDGTDTVVTRVDVVFRAFPPVSCEVYVPSSASFLTLRFFRYPFIFFMMQSLPRNLFIVQSALLRGPTTCK